MVDRFLITTADERSWRTDKPILFLGEWCRLYDRRQIWTQLDAEVVPYHWDDRQQLYKDYGALQRLYKNLLLDVSAALNEFHGVDHEIRYWRILIGPWLGYFIQMIFDRWVMIQTAITTYPIEGTVILDMPPDKVVPNNMADFIRLFCSDPWNHYIYGRIIQEWTQITCEYLCVDPEGDKTPITATPQQLSLKRQFKQLVKGFLSIISLNLMHPTGAFIISSYLPRQEDLKLQFALGQFPALCQSPSPFVVKPILSVRKTFRLRTYGFQGFEECVRTLIPEQIPTLYLEGYAQLQNQIARLSWPQHPKLIFTSNNHNGDDIFKAWTAEKVEKGSPLVVGQHGGHYGTGLYSFLEEHEVAISDRYFTWGWTDNNPKHFPICSFPLVRKQMKSWNPKGGLLLVTCALPRYSYWMYSAPVARQYLDYLDDQFTFTDYLPPEIRRQVLVRLYSQDYDYAQSKRWHDRHPDIRLNLGKDSVQPLIKKSRLYVSTYNATTFLETLGQNIPTIIFWNPYYWELRPSAQPYFEELKRVGIFHTSPQSAAAKVAEVWANLEAWWYSEEIQKVRQEFCDRFARLPKNPTKILKVELTNVIQSKKNALKHEMNGK